MRSIRRTAAIAAGALVLGVTGVAAAAENEPLNPYVVSGAKANADALARAGYDLLEGNAGGKFGIVATAKQAAALRAQGMTVTAPAGTARASARAAAAPVLANPTIGWDVFRPWNLQAAPCPSDPNCDTRSLKQIYDDLAKANPDIVTRVVYGTSQNTGQELVAYKVTSKRGAKRKPTVLYNAVQHAREWIAAETNRRLFAYYIANKDNKSTDIPAILKNTEIWFVPIVNPDGYDYTFQSKATRLWRKNLRDVNEDGQITTVDGVDPNRNWAVKWNYDLEGSSADSTSETYHGTAGDSESEVAALDALTARIRPKFQIDYHSFGNLILYPEGWQVETLATDGPLFTALAGDDRKPAIPNYDPDVSAELYTVNGDITDNSLEKYGTQAVTVELEGGSGPAVGGTQGDDNSFAPNGFVFQDSEAEVARVFQDNLQYALDLAKSAPDPDDPVSHLGNTAPNFVPTAFEVSTGSPQVVEVNAKRALGRVQVNYRINGGRVRTASTREFAGGEKYGRPGVYYHKLRGAVRGAAAGDTVEVWFSARAKRSTSFTYTQKSSTGNPVLILSAEDYAGPSGRPGATTGPRYLDSYVKALQDNGVGYDVYDTGGVDRVAPTTLGVLSHYKAVVMYTGDDLYTRAPGQPGGSGSTKLLDDEILAVRDYLNEGGKALITGQNPLQGAADGFLFNPLGPTPPNPTCPGNVTNGNGNADDPVDDDGNPLQVENCVAISNDFLQYWLGAYLSIPTPVGAPNALGFVGAGNRFGTTSFGLNGSDSAATQGWVGNGGSILSFLTTSSILKPDVYPQFASTQSVKLDRPAAFSPPTGTGYVYSQKDDVAYKRLTKTIDLTGVAAGTPAALTFKLSHDTEAEWDFVFVEANTDGTDWTTLPDVNGNTTQDTGLSCPGFPITTVHPALARYMTYTGPAGGSGDPADCTPTGTSGVWNGATGNSGGFQDWNIDLSAYVGKKVELSISYFSDAAVQGLGVFVDDVAVTAGAATVDSTSFEGDLGGWVTGQPADSAANDNNWIQTGDVGFVDGPGVATEDTLFWGFGFEGVTNRATRASLMKDALTYLGGGAIPAAAPRTTPVARLRR
jgi:hypothetical protein